MLIYGWLLLSSSLLQIPGQCVGLAPLLLSGHDGDVLGRVLAQLHHVLHPIGRTGLVHRAPQQSSSNHGEDVLRGNGELLASAVPE